MPRETGVEPLLSSESQDKHKKTEAELVSEKLDHLEEQRKGVLINIFGKDLGEDLIYATPDELDRHIAYQKRAIAADPLKVREEVGQLPHELKDLGADIESVIKEDLLYFDSQIKQLRKYEAERLKIEMRHCAANMTPRRRG